MQRTLICVGCSRYLADLAIANHGDDEFCGGHIDQSGWAGEQENDELHYEAAPFLSFHFAWELSYRAQQGLCCYSDMYTRLYRSGVVQASQPP